MLKVHDVKVDVYRRHSVRSVNYLLILICLTLQFGLIVFKNYEEINDEKEDDNEEVNISTRSLFSMSLQQEYAVNPSSNVHNDFGATNMNVWTD